MTKEINRERAVGTNILVSPAEGEIDISLTIPEAQVDQMIDIVEANPEIRVEKGDSRPSRQLNRILGHTFMAY